MNWQLYFLVFTATFLADIFWTFYIRKVSQGKAFGAASYSLLVAIMGAFSTYQFIINYWMIIPAALGAFIGTYFTVKWDIRK